MRAARESIVGRETMLDLAVNSNSGSSITTSMKQTTPRPAGEFMEAGRAAVKAGLTASPRYEVQDVAEKVKKHLAPQVDRVAMGGDQVRQSFVMLCSRDETDGFKKLLKFGEAKMVPDFLRVNDAQEPEGQAEVDSLATGKIIFDRMKALGLRPCVGTELFG